MSKALRYTFTVHGIVGIIVGAPLLLAPGRFLGWLGWEPIDPIISRLLGAAILALAWSSFRGSRAAEREQRILVEMELVFTILGCAGLLRHLLKHGYPWMVWLTLFVLAAFAFARAELFDTAIRRREEQR
jgi:hypothetical protein